MQSVSLTLLWLCKTGRPENPDSKSNLKKVNKEYFEFPEIKFCTSEHRKTENLLKSTTPVLLSNSTENKV